jgi:starch phosphorylase
MTLSNKIPSGLPGTGEGHHAGESVETLKRAIMDNLYYRGARIPAVATKNDWYLALAYTVRDRIMNRWIKSLDAIVKKDVRVVSYLSAEFLMGPHLVNNMINLGIYEEMKEAATQLGLDLETLIDQEEEPGLGNGGLGRLAACFMDSLATLEIKAIGYGVRYEFGIFDQEIRDGWQVEKTDKWLRLGNPWEIDDRKSPLTSTWRTHELLRSRGRYRVMGAAACRQGGRL